MGIGVCIVEVADCTMAVLVDYSTVVTVDCTVDLIDMIEERG